MQFGSPANIGPNVCATGIASGFGEPRVGTALAKPVVPGTRRYSANDKAQQPGPLRNL
jgi:hypothetical protein